MEGTIGRGNMVTKVVFLCLVIHFSYSDAIGDDPIFKILSTRSGLSHNTVFSITQDPKGFIWFGTREGLNRYDGTSIVTFYADPRDSSKLHSNHITCLETGRDSLLYVGTSRGLHVYNDKQRTFKDLISNGLPIGNVNRFLNSSGGTLWVASVRGLFAIRKSQANLSQLIKGINVTDIVEFRKGVFLISTLQKIMMINEYGEVLKEYTTMISAAGVEISMDENIFRIFKDSFDTIWLGSKKNGLFKYDLSEDAFKQVIIPHKFNPLEVNAIRVIAEGPGKKLWLGTEYGLFIYDPQNGSFEHYTQSYDQSPGTLSDKALYSIFRSKEDIMWIGTYFGGVNIVRPYANRFRTLKPGAGPKDLSGRAVSDIIQDKHGKIWIATEDGGVNIWDRRTDAITRLRSEAARGLSVNNIHCIYEDDDDIFWIGTFLGGVNRYDFKKKTITVYKKGEEEKASFPNNMIYAIVKDKNGEIWVGTTAGLNKFEKKKGTYEWFMPQNFKGRFIQEIYEDKAGGLWICALGTDSLFYYDPVRSKLSKFRYYDSAFIHNQGATCAFEDSKGNMWFGTINRGLLKLNRTDNTFTVYNKSNTKLPNDFVYGIQEDDHGNLWISTNKGLSKFTPGSEEFVNYDMSHGLPDNQFNFRSSFKDRDGWLYFGSINGLCYFHPDSLIENRTAPTAYFADLKLFNKSVPIGVGNILENDIEDTEEIVLNHSDNVFTVDFGSINYYSSADNRYSYYLEGFENDWNYIAEKNSATYTNLSPGDYVLKLRSANNDGIWSDSVKTLRIVILPPFWLSKWAIALYVVLVVALFFAYKAFLGYRNKEKMAVQIERMEREKLQEINQHKLNFFTYISHEFRTPLTLIMISIDKFLQDKSLNAEQTAGYKSIKASAKRLHSLVDQLMDFRRIETDHAQMNYAQGDIVLFLRDTFMAFSPLFNKKLVSFYFNSDITHFNAFFDADKLEKIVTNIVSNAAKYTENGVIEMEVSVKVNPHSGFDSITISVHDSGVGIEPGEMKNAFLPFYQTEHAKKSGTGTGIGLALVKSLVDFSGGSIEIASKQQLGTQVTVTLPLTKQIDNEKVAVLHGNRTIDIEHVLPGNDTSDFHMEQTESSTPEYQLMIVEDNEELISFLGSHFDKKYKIVKANNGILALDRIKRSPPDIIVSDVMMPEMDGIELCQAIKSEIGTSHIPVILLTAKTTPENRLDGLNCGADAYIAKPFLLKELELVIKNLLKARDKLRAHFLKFGQVNDAGATFANRDQDFILKLTEIVERFLDDSEFNIAKFAQEACVSRSLLHLKLKKVVNLSASEFIRNIRLQRAATMLKTTDCSISEVAYKVGYSDSNYFSRSFKEKYQVNPSEFKQRNAVTEG